MSMMNKEQKTVENASLFRQKISILHRAAVGVIMVRTREPFRAIETIRQFSQAEKLPFHAWTILRGWETYNASRPDAPPTADQSTKEPMAALVKVGSEDHQQGFFAMLYPHPQIKQVMPFIVQLKEYSKTFPETLKRLILVVPIGFSLPVELEDDVAILDFDVPSYAELRHTFSETMEGVKPDKRPRIDAEGMDMLLSASAGLTAHEAETALARAMVESGVNLRSATANDLRKVIMQVKVEAVRKTDILEVMDAEDMANVGGLENLKEWIGKRRDCFSDEAREFGIEPPKGFLLVGPPGTGKSLAAKATAFTMGLPLIKFDVSRVFAGIVGESEQRVRSALKMIEAMAPCVVLIDEVDKALGGVTSGGGDSGVSKRILGAILTWMQETKSPVFNVLSANRVDALPAELLRRGRLDEVFSVSVPNKTEIEQIVGIHLRKRRKDPAHIPNLAAAVEAAKDYVPAEIECAVKDAIIESFTGKVELTGDLIAAQFGNMVPISEAFAEDFESMKRWAENNARPANRDYDIATELQNAPKSRIRQRVAPQPKGRVMELGDS